MPESKMEGSFDDRYLFALNERDVLANRLNSIEMVWTDVLHEHSDLVKEYIVADKNVRLWEEILSCSMC